MGTLSYFMMAMIAAGGACPPAEPGPSVPASPLGVLLASGSMLLAAPAITALAVADRDAGFEALRRWAGWFFDRLDIDVRVEDGACRPGDRRAGAHRAHVDRG